MGRTTGSEPDFCEGEKGVRTAKLATLTYSSG